MNFTVASLMTVTSPGNWPVRGTSTSAFPIDAWATWTAATAVWPASMSFSSVMPGRESGARSIEPVSGRSGQDEFARRFRPGVRSPAVGRLGFATGGRARIMQLSHNASMACF